MLIVANEVSGTVSSYALRPAGAPFELQILHAADQEAGLAATIDAIGFSAVLEGLADDFANADPAHLGDLYIPGPFFNASTGLYGSAGVGDILINNALGWQAAALGNHEFDLGTQQLARLISGEGVSGGDFSNVPGVDSFEGAAFPYLSANLDFSADANLSGLEVADAQAPQAGSIAASTIITVNGERIGVVGAVTPTLETISLTGGVVVLPASDSVDELATLIQAEVDELTATGLDKVVLLAHMQQIQVERALATRLSGVDVIIAGGSNTLLAGSDDPLREGDTRAGDYPELYTSASGEAVYLVNTDGNYSYVGRLVLTFEGGVITSVDDASGAYATDDAGVDRVYGMDVDARDVASPVVVAVADAVAGTVNERDGNLFGSSEVYLDGRRGSVRTEETNLGNLTAEANLAYAQRSDPSVVLSLKNGGGIRAEIGRVVVPPGGTEFEFLPTEANPLVGKAEGDISQLDIENTLRFNNSLALVTVTAQQLADLIEHGIANARAGASEGRFPQVAGIRFAYTPDTDPTAEVNTGSLLTLVVLDDEGNTADIVVRDGEIVGDASRTFRIVTLGFLAGGGDGYPFPSDDAANVVDLEVEGTQTGTATFADDGTEQDAFAEFLLANFSDEAFDSPETPASEDQRIVDVTRNDTQLLPDGIGTVRGLAVGTEVQIEGIVTTNDYGFNNGQFYVQDETGGINVFAPGQDGYSVKVGNGSAPSELMAGDRVEIVGTVGVFDEQTQVSATAITVLSQDNDLPDAQRALPLGFDADSPLQGQRVELPFVRLADPSAWPTEAISNGGGRTVRVVTLSNDTLDVRIDRGESDFDGSTAPEGLFSLQGVLGRFRSNAQLLPFFEDELDDMGEGNAQFFHASKAAATVDVQPYVDLIPVGEALSYGEATALLLLPSETAYDLSITAAGSTDILATAPVSADDELDETGSIVIAAGDPNASGAGALALFASDLPEAEEADRTLAAHFFHGVGGAGAIELRSLFPTEALIASQDEDDGAIEFGDFTGTFALQPVGYTFAVTPPGVVDTRREALALFGGELNASVSTTLVVAGTTSGGLEADLFVVSTDGTVTNLAATTVSTDPTMFDVPAELTLVTPAPHPVRGNATVRFGLPQSGHARLTVFDALGREVAHLVDAQTPAGWHDAPLDGSSLSSGVYLYRLEVDGRSTTGTLTVVR